MSLSTYPSCIFSRYNLQSSSLASKITQRLLSKAKSSTRPQKQLKAKLEAKLAADPMLDIDVNRALEVSDLTVSDLTASIGIELPKKWTERFQNKTSFKRVTKALAEVTESSEN